MEIQNNTQNNSGYPLIIKEEEEEEVAKDIY